MAWLVFLGYVLLLVFFNLVDFYHHDFFIHGIGVTLYNFSRLMFIFYLLWLYYAVGDYVLSIRSRVSRRDTMTLEFVVLSCFAGVGVWHVFLLIAGFMGLYHRYFLDGVTALVLLVSVPRMNMWIQSIRRNHMHFYLPGMILLSLSLAVYMLTKGLYPSGGHDYYSHYFPYYLQVIEAGNILPNEVWYHFFYSKGAVLFFMSMLLTDPLAPQLTATSLIFMGAAIVFLTLRNAATTRLLPWLGASLYIAFTCCAFLIYIPGPSEAMRTGGWGDFEKSHEMIAVLMLALIWVVAGLRKSEQLHARGLTLLLVSASLVILNPLITVIAGLYLGLALLYHWITGSKRAALWIFSSISLSVFILGLLFLTNYMLTGMPEDQGLLLYWPIINFSKITDWGVLFELVVLHWMKAGLLFQQVPISVNLLLKIVSYLRLDVWGFLFLLSAVVFGLSLCRRQWRRFVTSHLDKAMLLAYGSFLTMIVCLAFVIGRDQPDSFYRLTSFTYGPTLCFSLLLLSVPLGYFLRQYHKLTITIMLYLGLPAAWLFVHHLNLNIENFNAVVKSGARFMAGNYSIADAYKDQERWPGRYPWGGIYPASEVVWRLLPPKTRVWSMHVHSYCMLPDCDMQGFMSYKLTSHAERVFFGEPQAAKLELMNAGYNYFFVSNSLQLTDPLPLSPLFAPENFAKYFGVVWTDGDNTLFTWKENALTPIDQKWLDGYRHQVEASAMAKAFPYKELQQIFSVQYQKNEIAVSQFPWSTHA